MVYGHRLPNPAQVIVEIKKGIKSEEIYSIPNSSLILGFFITCMATYSLSFSCIICHLNLSPFFSSNFATIQEGIVVRRDAPVLVAGFNIDSSALTFFAMCLLFVYLCINVLLPSQLLISYK